MGTESLRLSLLRLHFILFSITLADDHRYYQNANRQSITLHGLFTHHHSPSIHFALEQINTKFFSFSSTSSSSSYSSSPSNHLQFSLNQTEGIIHCDVGTGVKTFFDMLNRSSSFTVLLTDACQNVLSYISEIATFLQIPVISFTDSDLSLLSKDRYPYFYHIVPSDHAHNLVRKQLLDYFNWTRFGLIYQHGSKYTLVANDFSNLIGLDKKHFEVNLTRGLAYRHGSEWYEDNAQYITGLLNDFKARDVRIIIGNFNQTIATEIFCHAAHQHVYGSRYQWIILGYPSMAAWWNEPIHCSSQEMVRALNGTLQTRVPRFSMDREEHSAHTSPFLDEYLEKSASFENDYFDAYAYDTIWTLAYLYEHDVFPNQSKRELFRNRIDTIDFLGATGRVRYFNGGRVGEVIVEQFVACRMMNNGTCLPPCYEEDDDCNITVVKIFLGKHSESKTDPPILYPLNPIMWHGHGPPRDRTNQTVQFSHISLSVFISISLCSGIGLLFSGVFLTFNIHFRNHRYIRMSSPSLNNIILGGCMFAYMSIILMGINSSLFSKRFPAEILMNIICPIRVWILCISFTLAFGSMFGKTWRVHSIFTNINITKKGIHDSRLLIMVGLLLFIDFIFLISWQLFDPIHRQLVYDVPHRLKNNPDIEILPYREECRSQRMSLWFVILILYKGLLMFYGLFLAWKTRHVNIPALNDSRYIGLSVYVVFICSTLGSLVIFIPAEQIQFSYFLTSFFIVICTTATVCLVFVPKVIEVYRDPHSRKRQPRITNRLQLNSGRPMIFTQQDLHTAMSDNEELKTVLSMQEQTLTRLMDQLNNISKAEENHAYDTEPFEFERLIVSDEESLEEEDDEDPTVLDDEDNHHRYRSMARVPRALSLCLLNQIQIGQLYCPDSSLPVTRYSIPQQYQQDRQLSTLSKTILRQTHRHDRDIPFNRIPANCSVAITKKRSLSNNIENLFDGLSTLDGQNLEQMQETELVSSSNG